LRLDLVISILAILFHKTEPDFYTNAGEPA